MAAGSIHAKTTKHLGICITIAGLVLTTVYGSPSLGLVAGAWLGHMVTPDFDLGEDHPIYTQRSLINKYWLIGWIVYWYWMPYAKLMPHRGTSHKWPVGTLGRMIYLLWIPAVLLYLYHVPIAPLLHVIWYVFIAWSMQDWSHLRLDDIMPYALFRKHPKKSITIRKKTLKIARV